MEQCEMCGRWRFMMAEDEKPYSLHPFLCSFKCREESGIPARPSWLVHIDEGRPIFSFGPNPDRGDAE